MNLHRLFCAVLALGAMAAAGFSSAADTIQFAVPTAITGPNAQYGDMHRAGVRLAVDQINAKGGVLGKKIQLVEFDTGCQTKQAPAVANQIVMQNIKFVLGNLCTGPFKTAAPIYDDNDILMITSTATGDELSKYGYKLFFRTIGTDGQQGPVAAKYIVSKIHPKHIAIVHDKQSYGLGVASSVRDNLQKLGAKVEMFEAINHDDTDFSALITKMKERHIDFVYYGGYHPALILLLKQSKDLGLGAKWMGPEGAAVPDVRGPSAEGLLVTLPPDFSKEPANQAIAAAFRAKKQDPTGAFMMTSYAAVQVLTQAIAGSKSLDPDTVAKYMHSHHFKSVIGDVSFTPQGDWSNARFDVFQWHADASKTPAP